MGYTVQEIREQLKKSESYRDKYFKSRALRNIAWYNGNYGYNTSNLLYNNLDLTELEYHVNLAYSTSRTIVSSIYNRFPEFSFFLRGDISRSILEQYGETIDFQTEKLEQVLEEITKTYFKEMQARRTNRLAITDAVLTGFGVTKLGYNVDFNSETYKLLKLNQNIPTDKWVELASNIEVSDLVRRSEPYLLRVHPMNMLFPTDANIFNRISWQAEILFKDVAEVEEAYGVKGLNPTYVENWADNKDQSRKPNMIKLYEYHSLDPKFPYICVLADGYDKFLEKKEHPLYDKKSGQIKNMYQYIWFNEAYDGIYPQSDMDLVSPQISEANVQVKKRVEHIRKFVRMLVVKGILAPDQMTKLKKGDDGEVIEIPNVDGSVESIPMPDLSPDFYNNINMIRNEIYETLGLTDYAASVTTQDRKATEAQLVERSRIDRVQERIDIIEEFAFQQIDAFVEVMKEYQQVTRMFNMNLNNERISMVFAGELLKMGDIAIQVVPGSTVSLDRTAQINHMQQVSTILMNANMAQPGVVNIGKYLKKALAQLGENAQDYIDETKPMLPSNVIGNVGQLPQQINQPGVPTNTPMQLNQMPRMGGLM